MAEANLENVSKSFGETVAVSDLSLDIADGEFLVILGPTGAGKTTTLRLFAGLERPDNGTIRIDGSDVTEVPPAARDVAFVFQQYSLYPHYTVYDNLAFPLRAPGRRTGENEIKRRVDETAEMLRIGHKLTSPVTQLSGGEMQRVSIGRALVRKPNLFLMDEPLSSLDAKLREELRLELKRIQRDLGATILYVTHDQLEAMTLADRIGILEQGRLIQLDAPREVYERPATIRAAQRLGRPQVNLVPPSRFGVGDGPPGATTAGIRPEDLQVGVKDGETADLVTVEHKGDEVVALLEADGVQVHALVGADLAAEPGNSVQVMAREGAAIWFNSDGERLADAAS